MNDSLGVRRVQRVGNLDAQIEQHLHFQWTPGNAVLQRHAFQKFHGDKGMSVLLADLVNRADVRMVQRGSSTSFAAETFERLRVARNVFREKFQSDEAS